MKRLTAEERKEYAEVANDITACDGLLLSLWAASKADEAAGKADPGDIAVRGLIAHVYASVKLLRDDIEILRSEIVALKLNSPGREE